MTTMSRRPGRTSRPVLTAACTATLGLALALGAPVAGAQEPERPDVGIGSIGGAIVGSAEKAGLGSATEGLPGQCAATGSLGEGMLNETQAIPGEGPGQTAFIVDTNKPSEGSTTTENVEISWTNTDTGATGTLVEGHGENDIHWTEVNGEDVWGAVIDTGPGTVEWTMDATESGFFVGSGGSPYGGCGGTVTVP